MDKSTTKTSIKKVNKLIVKNPKRLLISIAIMLLIIIVVIIIINSKTDLTEVEDYSKLNSKKYSEELLYKYQSTESKERFLNDYDLVQEAVGLYIINNVTLEQNSLSQIIDKLKKELKKDSWNELGIEKPTFWNGTFDVTDEGIITFKFASESIEPTWINDDELSNKIVYNN